MESQQTLLLGKSCINKVVFSTVLSTLQSSFYIIFVVIVSCVSSFSENQRTRKRIAENYFTTRRGKKKNFDTGGASNYLLRNWFLLEGTDRRLKGRGRCWGGG